MGAGGRTSVPPSPKKPEFNPLKRVPCSKPPFTLCQIKKAIPPHCFKRFVLRSFSYLIYDLVLASLFYYVATNYFPSLPQPLPYVAWPLYWAMQGCIFTAFWALAHECGHQAFSDYQWLDDTIGFILHTFLLTPYFSLKYSHRRHHSNTGSLERDEVFVPKKKSALKWWAKHFNNPLGRFLEISIQLTLGWPLYLLFNITGPPYDRLACHYDPYGPIFSDRQRLQIYISDAGVLAVTYALYLLVLAKGVGWVISVYGVPLLVVNAFLVMITYLQHTHPSLPHYESSEWDWLRGALSTVDRDYGILNKVFHDITRIHVAHHLFPTIPHYHAMEATKVIKPILGEYYQFDGTPVYKAIWRELKECVYVEPDAGDNDKGVLWFRNKL
ncbi:hypothetical protein Gotri_022666 [Gossypium trilobum]|uniref:Uncharacterized protein n=1 Tax=Gossypium trilobum TaxID=34281 RepID=A0A7J9DGM0_9ROSI|nr:hypothetical protein [Gossypium trilobum]